MKTRVQNTLVTIISITLIVGVSALTTLATPASMSGAEPGKWTMDYESALKLAEDRGLSVFLDFTGSDWCGWCKLMDRRVFSEDGWSEFAADKLALVKIDFPKNKSLVPEEYQTRNRELMGRYRVSGYPTYVILNSDGTEIGRLGAGRNKTLETFRKEVLGILRQSTWGSNQFMKKLSPEEADEYMQLVARHDDVKKKQESWLKSNPPTKPENIRRFLDLNDEVTRISIEIETIKAQKIAEDFDPPKSEKYLSLYDELHSARLELSNWLSTGPKNTVENQKKRKDIQGRIHSLSQQIDLYY